jgi:hypothetical protein
MPHQTYKNTKGEKLPSVTTITGRFKNSFPLLLWTKKMFREGKDPDAIKDEAASAGTLAHEAIEAWKLGQSYAFPDTEAGKKAQVAFGAFLEWAKQSNLQITHNEVPLVSEKWQFGGCLDAMFVSEKRSLGDWKSSNGVYEDYLIQLAGYGILWNETHPDDPITGGFHLVRFDKENGDFCHHWYPELEDARKAFLLERKLYDIFKKLEKRVK